MRTLDEGISPVVDRSILICEVLGLDPAQTTHVRIELPAGEHPTVRWEGGRRLTPDEHERLIDLFNQAAEPPC